MAIADAYDAVLLLAVEAVVAKIVDVEVKREGRVAEIDVRGDLGGAAAVVAGIVFERVVLGILEIVEAVEFSPVETDPTFQFQVEEIPFGGIVRGALFCAVGPVQVVDGDVGERPLRREADAASSPVALAGNAVAVSNRPERAAKRWDEAKDGIMSASFGVVVV